MCRPSRPGRQKNCSTGWRTLSRPPTKPPPGRRCGTPFSGRSWNFCPLPDALRAHSSSLLTDLTAQDLLILEDTLEFLADRSAAIHTEALPGGWDGECYTLTDDSHAAVQTLFNVSPTEAQLSSASEP